MADLNTAREAAIAAVREAAILCRRVQARMVTEDSITKKDRSPVTVADFGSQALVCRTLRAALPGTRIVGEEDAADLRTPDNQELRDRVLAEVRENSPDGTTDDDILGWIDVASDEGGAGEFWALDPIDGTKGFLRGQQYAIALALVQDGHVVLGLLGCPNLGAEVDGDRGAGSLLVAQRGQGCVMLPLDGEGSEVKVTASATTAPAEARLLESVEAAHGNHTAHGRVCEALNVQAEPVRLDSQAKYAVLSRGQAEVYLRMPTKVGYREKIWDQAAGAIVIEEAGGRVTDIHGKPLDFSKGQRLEDNEGVIATNGHVHDAFLGAIKQAAQKA